VATNVGFISSWLTRRWEVQRAQPGALHPSHRFVGIRRKGRKFVAN
jgi:hypothetical protein